MIPSPLSPASGVPPERRGASPVDQVWSAHEEFVGRLAADRDFYAHPEVRAGVRDMLDDQKTMWTIYLDSLTERDLPSNVPSFVRAVVSAMAGGMAVGDYTTLLALVPEEGASRAG